MSIFVILVLVSSIVGFIFLCFILGYTHVFFEHNDLLTTIESTLNDYNKDTSDFINLFSEDRSKIYPDNFMDLSSSSDNNATEANNATENNNNSDNHDLIDHNISTSDSTNDQPLNQRVERDIESNRKLNPSTGGSQSSNIPQTEFERQPYLDNAPLPKSQSDPTSLGQNKK